MKNEEKLKLYLTMGNKEPLAYFTTSHPHLIILLINKLLPKNKPHIIDNYQIISRYA